MAKWGLGSPGTTAFACHRNVFASCAKVRDAPVDQDLRQTREAKSLTLDHETTRSCMSRILVRGANESPRSQKHRLGLGPRRKARITKSRRQNSAMPVVSDSQKMNSIPLTCSCCFSDVSWRQSQLIGNLRFIGHSNKAPWRKPMPYTNTRPG